MRKVANNYFLLILSAVGTMGRRTRLSQADKRGHGKASDRVITNENRQPADQTVFPAG